MCDLTMINKDLDPSPDTPLIHFPYCFYSFCKLKTETFKVYKLKNVLLYYHVMNLLLYMKIRTVCMSYPQFHLLHPRSYKDLQY